MQSRCSDPTVRLQDVLACGYPCDPGTQVLISDDSYCVGSSCPPNTTVDLSDNSICWKTPVTKTGYGCPAGNTEWLPGSCYRDCPIGFRENAQSCIIPIRRRRITQFTCPSFFVLTGNSCIPSPTLLLIIFSLIVVFIYKWNATPKAVHDATHISPAPPLNSAWRF